MAGDQDALIEAWRGLSELMIWGDQNKPLLFDYFRDANLMAGFYASLTRRNSSPQLKKQLLQSLSIMWENINSHQSIYYLLSNNRINDLVTHRFEFDQHEDLLEYYVTFLRALALKLDKDNLHFLLDESTSDFPLYTEAVRWFYHPESMVRIVVRTLTLAVFRVNDEALRRVLLAVPYFPNLAWYVREQLHRVAECVSYGDATTAAGPLTRVWADLVDQFYYMEDVFALGIPVFSKQLSHWLVSLVIVPLVIRNVDAASASTRVLVPQASALATLALFFHVFRHGGVMLDQIATLLLLPGTHAVPWHLHAPRFPNLPPVMLALVDEHAGDDNDDTNDNGDTNDSTNVVNDVTNVTFDSAVVRGADPGFAAPYPPGTAPVAVPGSVAVDTAPGSRRQPAHEDGDEATRFLAVGTESVGTFHSAVSTLDLDSDAPDGSASPGSSSSAMRSPAIGMRQHQPIQVVQQQTHFQQQQHHHQQLPLQQHGQHQQQGQQQQQQQQQGQQYQQGQQQQQQQQQPEQKSVSLIERFPVLAAPPVEADPERAVCSLRRVLLQLLASAATPHAVVLTTVAMLRAIVFSRTVDKDILSAAGLIPASELRDRSLLDALTTPPMEAKQRSKPVRAPLRVPNALDVMLDAAAESSEHHDVDASHAPLFSPKTRPGLPVRDPVVQAGAGEEARADEGDGDGGDQHGDDLIVADGDEAVSVAAAASSSQAQSVDATSDMSFVDVMLCVLSRHVATPVATLQLARDVLLKLTVRPDGTTSLTLTQQTQLEDAYSSACKRVAAHMTRSTGVGQFLEQFERDVTRYRERGYEHVVSDAMVMLTGEASASSDALAGMHADMTLPTADMHVEQVRHDTRAWLVLRGLRQQIRGEASAPVSVAELQSPPSSGGVRPAPALAPGDCIDITGHDVFLCVRAGAEGKRDRKLQISLVIEQAWILLVEPEQRRIGWAVVRDRMPLAMADVRTADSGDGRVLMLTAPASLVLGTQALSWTLQFGDLVRTIAVRQLIDRQRMLGLSRKMRVVRAMLGLAQPIQGEPDIKTPPPNAPIY